MRMYLYGNEESIQSEWSKQMIADETDHAGQYIIDDDNWHTFIEHEPIHENIKWNFHVKYGQAWKVTQYVPIKLHNISQNLRFRSSLRRAHMTFGTRQTTVTAQIYRWFEQCKQYGYLPNEVCIDERVKQNLSSSIFSSSLKYVHNMDRNHLHFMESKKRRLLH